MNKLILVSIVFSMTLPVLARESRGGHKTKVKCSIQSLQDAQQCVSSVAQAMPTENDENAALVTASAEAKELLLEILKVQGSEKDAKIVKDADYLAVVVQNDDESSLYYYVLNKGSQVNPRLVGYTINTADLYYEVCDNTYPAKFQKVQNQLLGMTPQEVVAGTVWLDDVICE